MHQNDQHGVVPDRKQTRRLCTGAGVSTASNVQAETKWSPISRASLRFPWFSFVFVPLLRGSSLLLRTACFLIWPFLRQSCTLWMYCAGNGIRDRGRCRSVRTDGRCWSIRTDGRQAHACLIICMSSLSTHTVFLDSCLSACNHTCL